MRPFEELHKQMIRVRAKKETKFILFAKLI